MADPNRPVTGYPAPNPNANGYAANSAPSGTSYPYAAPHPPSDTCYYSNPYYPQSYQPDDYSSRRATFLRRVFAFIIALVVIFGTITFIVWLVLRPELPEFRVDSASVSNLIFSNNSLVSFTSEVGLTATNPNKKMTLSYDETDSAFYYDSNLLAQTNVSPFSQGTKTDTPLTANFAAAGSFLSSSAVDQIKSDRSKGNVGFNLIMVSRVEFEAKAWRTRRRFLKVYCGNLSIRFPSNSSSGTLTGGPIKCGVRI